MQLNVVIRSSMHGENFSTLLIYSSIKIQSPYSDFVHRIELCRSIRFEIVSRSLQWKLFAKSISKVLTKLYLKLFCHIL